jgi:hypothetical protein
MDRLLRRVKILRIVYCGESKLSVLFTDESQNLLYCLLGRVKTLSMIFSRVSKLSIY